MVAAGLTYALYSRLRVVRLRQDLFDIRDWLFDEMVLVGALDDEAYRDARHRLNVFAKTADALSLPLFLYLWSIMDELPKVPQLRSPNPRVQALIDEAVGKSAHRVLDYLRCETARGWLMQVAFLWLQARRWEEKIALQALDQLILSDSPNAVSQLPRKRLRPA